ARADLDPLIEKKWISLREPEALIAAAQPVEVLQKWIAKHAASQPTAAAILDALCQEPSQSASQASGQAPGRPPGPSLPSRLAALPRPPQSKSLPASLDLLSRHDLVRRAKNPPSVSLNLTSAQVKSQAALLRKPNKRAAVLSFLARA